MRSQLSALLTISFLFISSLVMGQRIHVISGNPDAILNEKRLNVAYDYSGMDVGKMTEREYVDGKRNDYNAKEPGRGDKWAGEWVADRKNRFEPAFEMEFNKRGNIMLGEYASAKYTLIFHTVYTEPGYNVGVMRRNAYIDAEITIVETANRNNIVARISCSNCPGRSVFGTDFDNGERIKEAYAMAGKALCKYLER